MFCKSVNGKFQMKALALTVTTTSKIVGKRK
jgi:hypothetical protein